METRLVKKTNSAGEIKMALFIVGLPQVDFGPGEIEHSAFVKDRMVQYQQLMLFHRYCLWLQEQPVYFENLNFITLFQLKNSEKKY